jgi:hypothetical protein
MAYWGNDPNWLNLSGPQRAAAMALMEAEVGRGGINTSDARNALGAIINRAQEEGQPLGSHVSRDIYQPIIEDNQRSRLNTIINSPEFQELSQLAERRLSGEVPDWVGGADHYLAPPNTMLALEAKKPNKYKSWRKWTGFDPETNEYSNVTLADNSHHFLNLINPSDANPAPVASAAATPETTEEKNPMIEAILSSILGSGGGPAMAGKMTPLGQAGGAPAGGSMPSMAGGGMPAGGAPAGGGGYLDSFLQNNQQSSDQNASLAAQAMKNASASGPGGANALQRKPIDLSMLQSILARKPMLGFNGPNAGMMRT